MNIFVGNLSFDTTESQLHEAFSSYGNVTSAYVPTDRHSGRARGFAFVEMPSSSEATAAIAALNGREFQGRALTVNEAKPKEARPDRPGSDRHDRAGRVRRPS
jgi:RNA recognition motif-containing protein